MIMDIRGGIMTGHGQKMVYGLFFGRRGGVLIEHEQEIWYSDWTWAAQMLYGQDMGRTLGILTGHLQYR